MMENKDTNIKIPLISKIAYGMGDVGCNFSWMFVGNFLMIFYTDVFGISMSAVAGLMLFSRFWDAINDPVIGALSDKTHTRWGPLQAVASHRCTADIIDFDTFILGAPGVAVGSEDCLYDSDLLHFSFRLYMC